MDDDPCADRALTPGHATASPDFPDRAALALTGITKRFHGLTALDDVSLAVARGSIHALLGENGAGKTTLMRIAFGMVSADSGHVTRNGHVLRLASPADAIAAGIGMVHQQFSLVPAMTAAENIALGGKGIYRPERTVRRMADVARETGLALDPAARVADMSGADRQKLEIMRVLAHDADVLILDEPTAVLTPGDTGELFARLKKLAGSGRSVILITHKLRDAIEHADTVSVLRHGRRVLTASVSDVTTDMLAAAMLGGAHSDRATERVARPDSSVVARISAVPGVHDGIDVMAGEIVGLAALDGRATALLRQLAGRQPGATGTTVLPKRIGFVPENRQEEALVPEFTLTENLALKDAGERRGLLDWTQLQRSTDEVLRDFDVRATEPGVLAQTLSGGNQQRFVLGRELSDHPSLLVLENPTQGLDVQATQAIHERMRAARNAGTGIVFYSTDLDELADLSDRVIVVGNTHIVVADPDRNAIGRLLLADTRESDING